MPVTFRDTIPSVNLRYFGYVKSVEGSHEVFFSWEFRLVAVVIPIGVVLVNPWLLHSFTFQPLARWACTFQGCYLARFFAFPDVLLLLHSTDHVMDLPLWVRPQGHVIANPPNPMNGYVNHCKSIFKAFFSCAFPHPVSPSMSRSRAWAVPQGQSSPCLSSPCG